MKKFLSLFAAILFAGSMMAAVVSGTAYQVKGNTFPEGWSGSNTWSANSTSSYLLLHNAANYLQTDEFCQNGFTSIVVNARKYGGPSNAQLVISVEWVVDGADPVLLGTISPSTTSLADYTISNPATVTGNTTGYIKFSCKDASSNKGSGIQVVTINYTAGTCATIEPHTVSFSTGAGNPAVEAIAETEGGAGITLPAGPAPTCTNWAFAGWATAAVDAETTTAPTLLAADATYKPAEDVTLYAVYKRTEESGEIGFVRYEKVTEDPDDWSGKYLLAANTSGTTYYTFTGQNGTNNYGSSVNHTPGTTEKTDWEVEVAKTTNGYSIYHTSAGKYLGLTGSGNNLNFNASFTDEKFEWTLSAEDGAQSYAYNTRYIECNTSSSYRVACYTSSQKRFYLYKRIEDAIATYYYISAPTCTTPAPADIAWSAETAKAYLPADLIENTLPTLVNPNNVDIDYSVIGEDPENVAEINENGEITLKGAGTITVRASSKSTEYAHADADYTLIVYAPATKTIVGEVATEYEYGDEFDFSGLDVKVTYADDSERLIQNENINLSWYVTPGYVLKNGNVNVKAEGLNDFEVEQNYAVTVKTHSVTFENPEHGTLVIKNGDENITSGDAFVKTSEFTVVATPAEGYQLASLTAGGVDIMESKSFVLGTTDVEVVATFEALPTPKYYLHGTAVGSWDPHASYDDAYVISGLEAGTEYMLKVTHEGTWDNPDHVKGFYNLNPHTAGIYTNNDGNVCFKLAEAGDVTVTYIADNTFTVAGNFAMPTIQLKGSWDWAAPIDMTIDGGIATCEVTLNAASNYEFGFVLGGFWTANNYNYHKDYTTTEGVTGQAGNMKLLTDGEGKYIFTWTFENNVMSITFPGAATAIDQVAGAEKPAKVLRDGMIFIQKDGKVYTVTGRLVK